MLLSPNNNTSRSTNGTWNIVSETIRREYGFSDSYANRAHAHGYGAFNKRCLGSLYIIERMQLSHIMRKTSSNMPCINFKENSNLICTSNHGSRWIHVYDWAKDTLKRSLKTKHSNAISDVKFLKTHGNGLDIISACYGGHIRHTCMAPSGYSVSRRIFLNTDQRHRLITVPKSPLEFIAASSNGGIFQIDLRSERWSPCPDAIISGGSVSSHWLNIIDVAHHPLVPEICICGNDICVQVFDKRNLKEVLRQMYPNNLDRNKPWAVHHCSYSFDGSEILANYYNEGAYLFDNKYDKPGGYLHFYDRYASDLITDKFEFFGPKSEYIVRGVNGENICFQDKNTETIAAGHTLGNPVSTSLILETHSNLPVIAVSAQNERISIWAPKRWTNAVYDGHNF